MLRDTDNISYFTTSKAFIKLHTILIRVNVSRRIVIIVFWKNTAYFLITNT